MRERYLEDFAIGQIFSSGRLVVDEERIKSFAAEFDPQPFHLDENAAEGTLFRGLAASGWHTAAATMRLLVESEIEPAGGIVGGARGIVIQRLRRARQCCRRHRPRVASRPAGARARPADRKLRPSRGPR